MSWHSWEEFGGGKRSGKFDCAKYYLPLTLSCLRCAVALGSGRAAQSEGYRRLRSKESARRGPRLLSTGGGGEEGRVSRHTSKLYELLPGSITSCSSWPRSGTPSTDAMVSPG